MCKDTQLSEFHHSVFISLLTAEYHRIFHIHFIYFHSTLGICYFSGQKYARLCVPTKRTRFKAHSDHTGLYLSVLFSSTAHLAHALPQAGVVPVLNFTFLCSLQHPGLVFSSACQKFIFTLILKVVSFT